MIRIENAGSTQRYITSAGDGQKQVLVGDIEDGIGSRRGRPSRRSCSFSNVSSWTRTRLVTDQGQEEPYCVPMAESRVSARSASGMRPRPRIAKKTDSTIWKARPASATVRALRFGPLRCHSSLVLR